MKIIELNAECWESKEEFYTEFLSALGAPEWHGHNLDAVWDSISKDDLNEVKAPYKVVIMNIDKSNSELIEFIDEIEKIFIDAKKGGVDVSISHS